MEMLDVRCSLLDGWSQLVDGLLSATIMNPAIFTAATTLSSPPDRLVVLPLSLMCSFIVSNIHQHRRPSSPLYRRKRFSCFTNSNNNMAQSSRRSCNEKEEEERTSTMLMGATKYQVRKDTTNTNKWIRISFDDVDDTTKNYPKASKQKVDRQSISSLQKNDEEDAINNCDSTLPSSVDSESTTTIQTIPNSVLQWERQMRKIKAADRASKTNVNIHDHLRTIYSDENIVVTDKPSGILCVPGVNKNRSLLDLVYEIYGRNGCGDGKDDGANENNEERHSTSSSSSSSTVLLPPLQRDSMIVHRLDMDTSGIVIFARTRAAMSKLHESFRERTGTYKVYEALLVGSFDINKWVESATNDYNAKDDNANGKEDAATINPLGGGEINLPLQRDHEHPPFMRVSTPQSEADAQLAVQDLNSAGYKKLMAKKPKASTTHFRILSHEQWKGHDVTRVELVPITGRTHQLRVHCAAMGHPILGDSAYGFCGEAYPNGGFTDIVMQGMSPTSATFELRKNVEATVQKEGRTMCLHARKLTLDHPLTNEKITFEAKPTF